MRLSLIFALGVLFTLISCSKETDVKACYSIDQDGAQVTFLDCSENAEEYYWEFGDGNSSIARAPVHTYNQPGEYQATLKVNNSNGKSNTVTHLILIGQECTTCYVKVTYSGNSNTGSEIYCDTKQNVHMFKSTFVTNCPKNASGFTYSCWCD